ncbi:MAG: multidrug effflux MFS transporter [Francisellaceae bacterium]
MNSSSSQATKMPVKSLIFVLGVCIIPPFANDVFIPSLAQMSAVFHSSHISLLMTVFLLAMAGSQLLYGPLLDRFGRKPVLLTGLVIYTIASLMILFSANFSMLITARIFQGIGACSSVVSAMAIARDFYHGDDLISVMGLLMAIIGICPAIAPSFGGLLAHFAGWRGAFIFLLLLGIIYIVIIGFVFRESQAEKNHHALHFNKLIENYIRLLQDRSYRYFVLTSACSYGILFAYGAASSLIIIRQFQFSSVAYGFLFAANALIIFLVSALSSRIIKRIGLTKMMISGAILTLIGTVATLIINLLVISDVFTLMLPMSITTMGFAAIRPTASAGCMHVAPKQIAGSAAAMFNFMSFTGGAISTAVVSMLPVNIVNFSILVVILASLAVIFSCRNKRLNL